MNKYYLMTPAMGIVTKTGRISYENYPKTKEFFTLNDAIDYAIFENNMESDFHVYKIGNGKKLAWIAKESKQVTIY